MNLVLNASSLWSKWGFNDGDCPDVVLDHYDDDEELFGRVNNNWHAILTALVYEHLLPALNTAGHPTKAIVIQTAHNPVRAEDWEIGEPEWAYQVSVTVDEADVATTIGELTQ